MDRGKGVPSIPECPPSISPSYSPLSELRKLDAYLEEGRDRKKGSSGKSFTASMPRNESSWKPSEKPYGRPGFATATARRKGRQEGLEHYRDAFIHYFPDQLPLDRHFSDAFPYAQTYAQLSPLLRHGVPAPEVSEMEADPEENADLRGVGFSL